MNRRSGGQEKSKGSSDLLPSCESRLLLEIATNSLASALAAQAGGADRIELLENLGEGGCTPSYGTLARARELIRIPIDVLIRPRGGDFLYGVDEIDVMRCDIEQCVGLGMDGVVIGTLDVDGAIDVATCRSLMDAAGPLGVTFHRGFDAARDRTAALEAIIGLGCERVLTSGGCATAFDGADEIASLVRQAGDRIRIMAGAGITPENLPELAARSGAHEFHGSASARLLSPMRARNPALVGLDADWTQTDVERVRALVSALRASSRR